MNRSTVLAVISAAVAVMMFVPAVFGHYIHIGGKPG